MLDDEFVVERTSGVGERCTDVVNGVAVGPVPGFLVDEYRVQEVLEQDRVCVDGDGVEGIDYYVSLVGSVWQCLVSSSSRLVKELQRRSDNRQQERQTIDLPSAVLTFPSLLISFMYSQGSVGVLVYSIEPNACRAAREVKLR
jgi:hypothetical protein